MKQSLYVDLKEEEEREKAEKGEHRGGPMLGSSFAWLHRSEKLPLSLAKSRRKLEGKNEKRVVERGS